MSSYQLVLGPPMALDVIGFHLYNNSMFILFIFPNYLCRLDLIIFYYELSYLIHYLFLLQGSILTLCRILKFLPNINKFSLIASFITPVSPSYHIIIYRFNFAALNNSVGYF